MKIERVTVTTDELRRLFDYDHITGSLFWRYRDDVSKQWNTRYAGSIAGGILPHCVSVRFAGRMWLAHRLIWLYVYGRWPIDELDHINGDPHDNRIANLRECCHAENHQNRGRAVNNSSGFTGVSWHKRCSKWRANIKVNGRQYDLGLFHYKEEAHEAYLTAKKKLHVFQPVPRTE